MAHTWTLVCDSSTARLFTEGPHHSLRLLGAREHPPGRAHTHELVSDRQGRPAPGAGGPRSAYAPGTDPVEHQREHFARDLALWLHTGVVDGRCDGIVLVAPPKMLGLVRGQLEPHTAACLRESWPLDLAHTDDDGVAAAIDRARTNPQ